MVIVLFVCSDSVPLIWVLRSLATKRIDNVFFKC